MPITLMPYLHSSLFVILERPVNIGVTVILNWSGFSIVTKEMGCARSLPAFSYYTGITPPMTILPSLPTIKGFTVNNLRGSVRYWNRSPALTLGDLPNGPRGGSRRRRVCRMPGSVLDGLRISFQFETGPAACPTARSCHFGRSALRQMVQRMPGGVPDGLRISFWFETGPAACPTARLCRFGRSALWRMVRRMPGSMPDGLRISFRFEMGPMARFEAMANSTTASQVRSGKEYAHAHTSQGGRGSKPGATRPGRSNDMPNVSLHRLILSGPVGEWFYRPIREREDIGSMTSLLVSCI